MDASTAFANATPVRFDAFPMDAPDDVRALRALLDADPSAPVVAVFAKTEGNGLDNDWSRPLAVRALREAIAGRRADADAPEPVIVVSGGCEGFIAPHGVLVRGRRSGVRCGVARSAPLAAEAIGRAGHVRAAAETVRAACRAAGLAPNEVRYAHLLTPWVEPGLAAAAPPVAGDAHGSKPFSRAAGALGAAVALDGLAPARALQALETCDAGIHGSRCAVTAGATAGRIGVLVFGDADGDADGDGDAGAEAPQRVAATRLDDPLDAAAAARLVPAGARVAAAFYKGDPPPDGRLRGERLVMAHDSDVHAFRHYRAAMSGVLGAALGTTRLFVGGGCEHQCPAGGGLLAVVTERTPA
jgi:cyanuric acid amidohydrolase